MNMGKDNSINRQTNEIHELKKTVSRATSEIKTSIGNIENLNKETVQTTQKIQNAGNELRKLTNEIETIENDKKGDEDAEHKKKAARGSKITWAISTGISFFSLLVAIATFVITRNIGITANDMNMKTQEITYSFSNDLTHNTNVETLNKEFGELFEHQNLKIDMSLSPGIGNESQVVQFINSDTNQIEYIGAMFSCYPVSSEICGEVTGIVVSSDESLASETAIYDHTFTSKFFSLNKKNKESTIEHQFIFGEYSVFLAAPNEDEHLSFLVLKKYSEENTEPIVHNVYVALQGYSGKLRQFAIKVRFENQDSVFSTIDENDIYDLGKVFSFAICDTEIFGTPISKTEEPSEKASDELTNGDVVNAEESRFRNLDYKQQQEVIREAQELESNFSIIRDRYEK